MINFKCANKYCRDDISLIENYKLALNDTSQTWDIHHRLESDLGLSADELMKQNRYLNVPANELIFLTHSDHMKLHNHGENSYWYGKRGKETSMYGKNSEDYMSEEAIKEKRKKQSIAGKKRYEDLEERKKQSERMKGENNPMYNKKHREESKQKMSKTQKQNESQKGENNPMYGTHWPWMNNGIIRVRPKNQEEIDYYTSLGYHPGFKLK